MATRKAPKDHQSDLSSEAWNKLPWRKLEKHCFRVQKRIYRASQRGNTRAVHKLQKLLMVSAHIPMDKNILAKWLKAGFIEKQVLHPTEEGTPQGGICSPVVANLALDGLERKLLERYPKPKTGYKERYFKSTKGNNWVFYGGIATKEGFVENYLLHPAHVPIKRHVKIKGEANPYDPAWEEYFEKCLGMKMVHNLNGRYTALAWLLPVSEEEVSFLPHGRERRQSVSGAAHEAQEQAQWHDRLLRTPFVQDKQPEQEHSNYEREDGEGISPAKTRR